MIRVWRPISGHFGESCRRSGTHNCRRLMFQLQRDWGIRRQTVDAWTFLGCIAHLVQEHVVQWPFWSSSRARPKMFGPGAVGRIGTLESFVCPILERDGLCEASPSCRGCRGRFHMRRGINADHSKQIASSMRRAEVNETSRRTENA